MVAVQGRRRRSRVLVNNMSDCQRGNVMIVKVREIAKETSEERECVSILFCTDYAGNTESEFVLQAISLLPRVVRAVYFFFPRVCVLL